MYAELAEPASAAQPIKSDHKNLDRLELTTQNCQSGKVETVSLRYRKEGDNYVIAATTNERGTKPSWFLSLKKEPMVQLKLEGIEFYAQAKTPTGRERLALLPKAQQLVPDILNKIPRDTCIVVMCPMW